MPARNWTPQASTEPPPAAALVNQYRATITSGGFVAIGNSMADFILLPGVPDTLEIHVLDNAAVISVGDASGAIAREITIGAGGSSDTLIRDRLIRARNLTSGSTARIQV